MHPDEILQAEFMEPLGLTQYRVAKATRRRLIPCFAVLVSLSATPGCIFYSLDRTDLSIAGVPSDARNVFAVAEENGRLVPMPPYICKVYCAPAGYPRSGGPPWTRRSDDGGSGEALTTPHGTSWRSGDRYGAVFCSDTLGWRVAWQDEEAASRRWTIPFLFRATARFEVVPARAVGLTPAQIEDVDMPYDNVQ